MMNSIFCKVCDFEIISDRNELEYYIRTLHKKWDRGLYYNYIIKDINLDNINKIYNNYISIHNEKFNHYFINCIIQINFDNNTIANLEISNRYNTDYINIENYLSMYLKCLKGTQYIFQKINHMIINITSCICNIKIKHYQDKPMSMLERRINYIITKNSKMINLNHHNPLIRKYHNIKLNNI